MPLVVGNLRFKKKSANKVNCCINIKIIWLKYQPDW